MQRSWRPQRRERRRLPAARAFLHLRKSPYRIVSPSRFRCRSRSPTQGDKHARELQGRTVPRQHIRILSPRWRGPRRSKTCFELDGGKITPISRLAPKHAEDSKYVVCHLSLRDAKSAWSVTICLRLGHVLRNAGDLIGPIETRARRHSPPGRPTSADSSRLSGPDPTTGPSVLRSFGDNRQQKI